MKKTNITTSFIISFFLLYVSVIIILPQFFSFIEYFKHVFVYPYPWALTENENTTFAFRLISHQPLYISNTTFPVLFSVYPPFYYILTFLLSFFFPYSITLMRAISATSLLLICSVLFLHQNNRFNNHPYNFVLSLLLVGFFTCNVQIASFYPLARVDLLALALLALLYLLTFKAAQTPRSIFLLLNPLLVALTAMTKQSNLAFIFLPVFMLLIYRNVYWLKQLILSIITLATFVIVTQYLSSGYFLDNVWYLANQVYGKSLFSKQYAITGIKTFYLFFKPLIIATIILTIVNLKSIKKHKIHQVSLVFPLIVLLTIYKTAGNSGAGANTYILPLLTILLAFKYLFSLSLSRSVIALTVPLILLTQSRIINIQPNKFRHIPSTNYVNGQRLVNALKASPPQILGDRIDYYQYLAGQSVILEASTFKAMSGGGSNQIYHPLVNTIVNSIQSHQINTAVIGLTQLSSPTIRESVYQNMNLVDNIRLEFLDVWPSVNFSVYTR